MEGKRVTLRLQLILSTGLGLLLALFGRPLTRLFVADASEELLRVSYQYLLITAVPGALAGLMFTYQQLLRGVGDTVASMRGGLIQLAVKVAAIVAGALAFRNLTLVWTAWPLSFAAAAIYLLLHYRKSDIERKEST